eukprot:scaffold346290_cov50-Prasinocladus_malaysianus.AAC.1
MELEAGLPHVTEDPLAHQLVADVHGAPGVAGELELDEELDEVLAEEAALVGLEQPGAVLDVQLVHEDPADDVQ